MQPIESFHSVPRSFTAGGLEAAILAITISEPGFLAAADQENTPEALFALTHRIIEELKKAGEGHPIGEGAPA